VVPDGRGAADLWYEAGMAYDDQRKDAQAIAAFSNAIERDDHGKAKFQRGNAYVRIGDLAKAKRDLEDFVAAPGNDVEFARAQANMMLAQIATKLR